MASSIQLNRWCVRNNVRDFIGVFCSSEAPMDLEGDFCCVLNHSPCDSRTGGTHWLACRVKGKTAYWFDSYGLPPSSRLEDALMGPADGDPKFDEWLDRIGVTQIFYNPTDLQSVFSDVCGLYAVYFLKHGLPDLDKSGAWNWLGPEVTSNDIMIQQLVDIKL